jgi:biopolymer transport protein ExbD
MRFRGSIQQGEELGEINISPMIDMVFILLIFFIVTTVFVEEPGVDIAKPPAQSAVDLPKNSLLFAVTEDNEIFYGGSDIGLEGIRQIVRPQMEQDPEMTVIFQIDDGAAAGTAIRAIDEARFSKAINIYISTDKNSRG